MEEKLLCKIPAEQLSHHFVIKSYGWKYICDYLIQVTDFI